MLTDEVLSAICAFAVSLTLASSLVLANDRAAFPGAEGSGATTPGGRGGQVYLVTSLNDSGTGSLREGCEAEGPRMVVVNVDGIIELESPIEIRSPFITIAGQAAPGGGVCLKNHGFHITADDVILRFLRIRPGDGRDVRGIGIDGGERVVIDHCSVSWSTGPAVAVYGGAADVTLQWNVFAETFYSADPAEAKAGIGVSIRSDGGTFSVHHNYFAHHYNGSPFINGAGEPLGTLLDFRNNVVYDWGQRAGASDGGPVRYNIVGNSYKAGPSTPYETRAKVFQFNSVESRIHGRDNALAGSDMVTGVNFFMWEMPEEYILRVHIHVFQPDTAFPAEPVTMLPAEEAARRVLAEAGATRPLRDAVDNRVVAQHGLEAGRLVGSVEETGGWPEYVLEAPSEDEDRDGMPDEWERNYGLSPDNPADHALDQDEDGYTNIEEYLNSVQPPPLVEH